MESKEELRKKIEGLKIKMIQSSEERGMNNHLTIHISQELDKLINEYMKIDKKKWIENQCDIIGDYGFHWKIYSSLPT